MFKFFFLLLKGEQAHQRQSPSPKPALPPKRRTSSNVSSLSQPGIAIQPQSQPVGAAAAATLASTQPGVVMVGGNPMVVDPATGMLQPQAQPQPAFLQSGLIFFLFCIFSLSVKG